MVRVLDQDQEPYKSKLVHFKGMYENGGRQTQRSTAESSSGAESPPDDRMISRSKALGAHRSRYDGAGAGSHSKDNRPSGKSEPFTVYISSFECKRFFINFTKKKHMFYQLHI